MPKPPTLAWPTAGRRASIAESIGSFVANVRAFGHSPELFIASDNLDYPETGLSPEVARALEDAKKADGFDYEISTVSSRKELIRGLAAQFDESLLNYALLPEPGVVGWGVNVNSALLYGAGAPTICTDDDIVVQPARPVKAALNPSAEYQFTESFLNSELYYYRDRQALLDSVKRVEKDVLGSYLDALQNSDHGGVLLANPGLYGESGMGSARGLLSLEGLSREHLTEGGYESLRYSRELVRIPEQNTISRSVHFLAGSFAADNSLPIAPFIPYGRNCDGLASLITRIAHPDCLNAYLDFGLYHSPPERGGHSDFELRGFAPGFPDMIMALILGIAPDASIKGYKERFRYLGSQFCKIAAFSASRFVDIFYAAWSHQFAKVIEELESRLDKYERHPWAWAEDVDAHIDSLNYYMREPVALFGKTKPREGGCGLTISEAKRHLELYGGLLECWPELQEKFIQ